MQDNINEIYMAIKGIKDIETLLKTLGEADEVVSFKEPIGDTEIVQQLSYSERWSPRELIVHVSRGGALTFGIGDYSKSQKRG